MTISFRQKVYEITRKIPKGKVATYGQIAKIAGKPAAARAVGMCMKFNHDAPTIPCHRIVAASGDLRGYSASGGIKKKRKMLMEEGVIFIGKKVNLSISRWGLVTPNK